MSTEQWSLIISAIQAIAAICVFFRIDVRVLGRIDKNMRTKMTGREWFILILLCGSLAFSGFGYYRTTQKPITVVSDRFLFRWGAALDKDKNVDRVFVTVDSARLLSNNPKYKLAAVAFHDIGVTERLDITDLQKSTLFDIKPGAVEIHIPLDSKFKENVKRGYSGIFIVALLVPNDVMMNQFSTLRQAYSMGVKELGMVVAPP